MGREVFILGTDPGFASFGFSVARLTKDAEEFVRTDVIRTQKSAKKQNVKAADDNFRRGQAIAAVLDEVVKEYQPMAIAAEAASWPRNAGATAKVAMSWGILITLCYQYRLPMVQASPQEIKKALCNDKSASKEAVREAIERRYPGHFDEFKHRFPAKKPPKPNGQWEHGFDAAGAIVTCLDTDVLRMARGMAGVT
jgi:crossover junction endodeoxyribonuclease RuvC